MRQSALFVERRVHHEPIEGPRALACAIIRLAIDDVRSTGHLSRVDRQTALDLLSDTRGVLTAWCQVAGLDATCIREKAQRDLRALGECSHVPGVVLLGEDAKQAPLPRLKSGTLLGVVAEPIIDAGGAGVAVDVVEDARDGLG
jgi:hypothetical protein